MYDGVLEKVHVRVKLPALLHKPEYEGLRESLEEEIHQDYQFSIRRAIGWCIPTIRSYPFTP